MKSTLTGNHKYKLLAILLIVISIGIFVDKLYFIANSETAQGEVHAVDLKGKATTFVVSYSVGESNFRVKAKVTRSPTNYKVGDKIIVYYDPEDPSSYLIDDFLEKWILAIFLAGLGMIFYGFSLLKVRHSPE